MSAPEPSYSPSEAAAKLGLPESWLKTKARAGAIPRHTYGRYIRFTDSDLAAIQRQHAQSPMRLPRRS